MADEKRGLSSSHYLTLQDRNTLAITGVTDIDSFDETEVVLYTEAGELTVRGAGLHLNKIDLETGELSLEGEIWALSYSDNLPRRGGFFARLWK